jgi:hypothetical protein
VLKKLGRHSFASFLLTLMTFEWKNEAGSSALFLAQALHSLRGKHNVGKTGVIALTSR